MKALAKINFVTLLDVGGAEGYKAYVAKQLFDAKVKNTDLSSEACKRAEEIFYVESIPADIHNLPFIDNEFDSVLCSESLEHVSNLHKAVEELLRITKNALIITVPHETEEEVHTNIDSEIPHGHIHSFSMESFDYLEEAGYKIIKRKIFSPLSKVSSALIEATPKHHDDIRRYPKIMIDLYNAVTPLLRKIIGTKIAGFLINLDELFCKVLPHYKSILFIILKDNKYYNTDSKYNITPNKIINFAVPYFYLKDKE